MKTQMMHYTKLDLYFTSYEWLMMMMMIYDTVSINRDWSFTFM